MARKGTPMSTISRTVNAKWMSDQYVVTDTGTDNEWYSVDGDSWCDQNGRPITDEEFDNTRIVLCGGPRDGEAVA